MDAQAREPQLRALMLASLEGDAAAHVALLRALAPRLRAYFSSRLQRSGGVPADAEDLVQETLMTIHTRRNTYNPEPLLTPWVYAIARHRFVDHLRRNKRSVMPVLDQQKAFLGSLRALVELAEDRFAAESVLNF